MSIFGPKLTTNSSFGKNRDLKKMQQSQAHSNKAFTFLNRNFKSGMDFQGEGGKLLKYNLL